MDHPYMSPIATTSTNVTMSATRGQHQTSSQVPSPEEQMRRQLDELNRSVTIVIWYKADHEPIRLQKILPTFPYFQLSGFSNIISDLGLSSTSYLDTYIPDSSQWEQHTISSVRIVGTQQRLLYRVRRSLVDGLSEDQCPRIQDELQMQSNCAPPPLLPTHTRAPSFHGVVEPRNAFVTALYNQASDKGLVLVRASPASRKTTFMTLLLRYILAVDKDALVSIYDGWPNAAEGMNIDQRFDQLADGPSTFTLKSINRFQLDEQPRRRWILLDKAQKSYGDDALWTIFKNIQGKGANIVCFATYGSNVIQSNMSREKGAPIYIPDDALVGLFPSSDVTHGLCYTRNEYDTYIARIRDSVASRIVINSVPPAPDLADHIFVITAGHPGAVETMLTLTNLVKKKLNINEPEISLDNFYTAFTLAEFFYRVRSSQYSCALPSEEQPVQPEEVEAPHQLLDFGNLSIPPADSRLPVLSQMCKKGWITIEKFDMGGLCVQPSSPLFGSWISYFLQTRSTLPSRFLECDLFTFWKTVVDNISLSALRETPLPQVKSCTATVIEDLWQKQFYRAACAVTNGAIQMSPEYRTPHDAARQGRIDFLVIKRGWGIEIIRDGNELEQHGSRFKPGGAYHPWISGNILQEYVMLDFRRTTPMKAHPSLPQLFHVVFAEDYSTYTAAASTSLRSTTAGRANIVSGYLIAAVLRALSGASQVEFTSGRAASLSWQILQNILT
ncbi:unnamed protein product [Cyclocybe aegerita]|uniref:Uncharacterized protein n=1 Tax=Cyclocybe aegerita TaxID=1973307 RepID=A0A8S0X7E8_CYCAE|nr:unnamed protein product [Cyclocybe aegerita]